MSIVAYVGLPGSGKSYSVVELQILPAMKAGRTVVTNIPLIREEWDKLGLPGELRSFDIMELKAEPERIMEYCEPGCIFIIDECWNIWPQGLTADQVPDVYKKLLAEHRHMVDKQGNSTQIVLVVQSLANISKFARELVETTFVTTKLSFVGLSRAYRVDVFHGMVTGCTPNPKKAQRQLTGRYRQEIYRLYKSHTMSEAASLGANESKMDNRQNIFRRPVFVIGVVLVPVLVIWSLHTFAANFHGFAMKSEAGKLASRSAPVPAQRSGAGPVPTVADRIAVPKPVDESPRLLVAVFDAGQNGRTEAYVSDRGRVVWLDAAECRVVARRAQCLYRGEWVDAEGSVGEAAPAAPVGVWTGGQAGRSQAVLVGSR